MNAPFTRQKGVALIIVLLIVAIVSVLATEMGTRLQLQVKRASNIKDNNQAYWYAMGAEQYARKSLKELIENSDNIIHLEQPWNQEFVYPLENGGIQAQLVDMQSCFNLNALKEPGTGPLTSGTPGTPGTPASKTQHTDRVAAFQKLLELVDGNIPTYNIEILRDSLLDWLDENDQALPLGAEDSEYEGRQFPYLTANNYMVHKSELRMINGIEVKWLDALLELVCVIPSDSLFVINVNTVSEDNAAIIAAATGLDLVQAKSVISNRGSDGFGDVADFLALTEIKALSLSAEKQAWFDITTSYFILHTKTKYNNATFAMQSLFKIDAKKEVSVITREFSGF
jgi:general secretion pathway protein K